MAGKVIKVVGKLACIVAALVWMSVGAKAATKLIWSGSIPPAQFDVPYEGVLTIWKISERDRKGICSNDKSACVYHPQEIPPYRWCDLYIIGEVWKEHGWSWASVLRHEIAHCNGWPGDHAGGRKVDAPTTRNMAMPKLPSSTRWLTFAPPVVCFTPTHDVEPCDNRQPNNRDGHPGDTSSATATAGRTRPN